MRARKGSITFFAMAITLVIAMITLPVFASNISTLFAGTDALDQAIQAQQYALIEADILRATAYDSLDIKPKAAIAGSGGFQREVLLSDEETIDGTRQRIATVDIYKDGEDQKRYSLKVPLSTAGSSAVPVGTIIIWGSANNPANGVWLDCNGQSTAAYPELTVIYGATVPDYRGMFLRGYGSTTVNYGTYGATTHTSAALNELQGNAIRNITGSTWGIDAHEVNDNADIYTGPFYIKEYGYLNNVGINNMGMIVGFDASRVVPTANENRPVNRAVRYLIKAA